MLILDLLLGPLKKVIDVQLLLRSILGPSFFIECPKRVQNLRDISKLICCKICRDKVPGKLSSTKLRIEQLFLLHHQAILTHCLSLQSFI